MTELLTPSAPWVKRREGLLVPGHRTNWRNVNQTHGKTRFRIRGFFPDKHGYGVSTHHFWRHFIDDPEDAEDFWRILLSQTEWPSWVPSLQDYPGLVYEFATVTFLTSTAGSPYSTPANWNSSSNSIECLGGSGGPTYDLVGGNCGAGGSGGAYAKATNVTIAGSISYVVGVAGAYFVDTGSASAGGDTYFNGASLGASSCGAKGGAGAITTNGAVGGAASGCVGGVGGGTANPGAPYAYNGGNGTSQLGGNGGAGGGAAGPNGAGGNASARVGGTGDNGLGGAGGPNAGTAAARAGGNGTEWDASHGSGGGGGDTSSGQGDAATGGNYGGGASSCDGSIYGATVGTNGLIVVTYTPYTPVLPGSFSEGRVFGRIHSIVGY